MQKDEQLLILLDALNQITLDYLEKLSNTETNTGSTLLDPKTRVFGLNKMLETINVNLHRIDIFWDLVMDHFLCIANSKNSVLRKIAVETLNSVINSAFTYFFTKDSSSISSLIKSKSISLASSIQISNVDKEEKEASAKKREFLPVMKEKWGEDNWQQVLLQPWLDIIKTSFVESNESIMNSLLRLLQNTGHELGNKGWTIILNMLDEVSMHPNQNYTGTGNFLVNFIAIGL